MEWFGIMFGVMGFVVAIGAASRAGELAKRVEDLEKECARIVKDQLDG